MFNNNYYIKNMKMTNKSLDNNNNSGDKINNTLTAMKRYGT